MTHEQASRFAHGGQYPGPRAVTRGSLVGAPIRASFGRYAPVEDARMLTDQAVLFIVAENEELLDNETNAKLAHDRMPGQVKKYIEIPGIGHYGVYAQQRQHVVQLAIDWFDEYLRR